MKLRSNGLGKKRKESYHQENDYYNYLGIAKNIMYHCFKSKA